MRLSILIPSLSSRKEQLEAITKKLLSQSPDCEVVPYVDDGQMSIGMKRNVLLRRAKGDYVAFVDDDDDVSDDYVSKILEATKSDPDCCSLNGIIIFRDGYARFFIHSLKYPQWVDDHKSKIYYRPPNHLNAVKRSIATSVVFPNINSGEDRVYSMNLASRIKNEVAIQGVIYTYRCSTTFEEAHRGLSRDYNGE